MTEIRTLRDGDSVPEDAAWVSIKKEDGKFNVSGQAAGLDKPVFFAGPGFDTAEEAIKASVAWADLLGAGVLYVRGVGNDEGPAK